MLTNFTFFINFLLFLSLFLFVCCLVFRAGEQGRFWYAVLGGSLEVRYHATDADGKVSKSIL